MMSFCGEKFNERRWNFLVKEKKIMLLRRRTSWDVWLGFVDAIGWKKKRQCNEGEDEDSRFWGMIDDRLTTLTLD